MIREGLRGEDPHNQIRHHKIGEMDVEMIHQTLSGDCVLIDYLNTESLVNGDGKVIMSPRELRDMVIAGRRESGLDPADILADNSPLSYRDKAKLFQAIYNVPARQEDVVTVNGRMNSEALRANIEHGVLEYLDTYHSGLCTTGMGYHSRSIWKIDDNYYIVIDPMDANGFTRYNKQQLVNFLTNLCINQEPDNNFFLFIRDEQDGQQS